MDEILTGVFHWAAIHEDIHQEVHSYLITVTDPAVLIDPMLPAEGIEWFENHKKPEHILLTNRLHDRHCKKYVETFGVQIWCHQAGMHEFGPEDGVMAFNHGDELPGGIEALEVGSLCPEETALYMPHHGGILSIGDAIIRYDGALQFVPDWLMGDGPEGVKAGLKDSFVNLLQRDFNHLLFAHGKPLAGGAKVELQAFVDSI